MASNEQQWAWELQMCRDFDGLVDHYRGACAGAGDPLGELKGRPARSLKRYAGLMAGPKNSSGARELGMRT